jgi:hypothetical protein
MVFERRLQRRLLDPAPDLGAGAGERLHVVDVERVERAADARDQLMVHQEFAKRVGGGGKAGRHAHIAMRELADHFTERGVLATHPTDVLHGKIFKPRNVLLCHATSFVFRLRTRHGFGILVRILSGFQP